MTEVFLIGVSLASPPVKWKATVSHRRAAGSRPKTYPTDRFSNPDRSASRLVAEESLKNPRFARSHRANVGQSRKTNYRKHSGQYGRNPSVQIPRARDFAALCALSQVTSDGYSAVRAVAAPS